MNNNRHEFRKFVWQTLIVLDHERIKIQFTPLSGKALIREVSATYKREGNTLRMKWHRAGRNIETLDGDFLTMKNEESLFSYRKQPEQRQVTDQNPPCLRQ